ncbi:binding--dependent transport system inner membrane component family protein, partial [Vibrio parahaemolyticus VPTS-2010]
LPAVWVSLAQPSVLCPIFPERHKPFLSLCTILLKRRERKWKRHACVSFLLLSLYRR